MLEKLEKTFLVFVAVFYGGIILAGLPVLLIMTMSVLVHIFTGKWLFVI